MRLLGQIFQNPASLGILPGTFNPPTTAHMALAQAALAHVEYVLLVLPGVLPHKPWEGATKDERMEMLRRVTASHPRLGAAVSEGGLFIDMAAEAREHFPAAQVHLVCGRDAAERIIGWDYGDAGAVERMLKEFRLLVAPRNGPYSPPDHVAHAVTNLAAGDWDHCSSTVVREGERVLVPDEIRDMVQEIYGR